MFSGLWGLGFGSWVLALARVDKGIAFDVVFCCVVVWASCPVWLSSLIRTVLLAVMLPAKPANSNAECGSIPIL